jgi:NTE family protein
MSRVDAWPRVRATAVRCGALGLAAWCLAGCYRVHTPRLDAFDKDRGYRFKALGSTAEQEAQDETFIALSFSGGGTRAAAFAYGALEALKATDIGGGHTLLDEVDVISSVSGGSFAAAYLGLFGQTVFFAKFPDAVLYRRLESGLIWQMAAPWNWPKLLSPYYGRGDLADQYYDSAIFEGRTFRDLPPRRPFIVLNATDISRGAQFSFTQDYFDRICANLADIAVSRGVTASSAFPVAFTPLTVENYGADSCHYEAPAWVGNAECGDFNANPQRYDLAKTWRSYENASRRPFIHLSDGGLADNIGLRAVESGVLATNSLGVLSKVNRGRIKRLVVIVVDAKPHADPVIDRGARPPSIYTVLNASATNPMENYSSDTVERMRLLFNEWDRAACDVQANRAGCDALATEQCERARRREACEQPKRDACYARLGVTDPPPPHPALYLMHIRFAAIPDSAAKQALEKVDTRLQLPRDQVDLLVKWGHRLVAESADYQELVADIRGDPHPPRPRCQPSAAETVCDDPEAPALPAP